MDWIRFMEEVISVEGCKHRIMPPCPTSLLVRLESKWGALPTSLRCMLEVFNGGELFINAIPMITVLGVTTAPPQSRFTWPPECCMDTWMELIRSIERVGWPIARSSYGSFWILLGEHLREWDFQTHRWLGTEISFDDWTQRIIKEGKLYCS